MSPYPSTYIRTPCYNCGTVFTPSRTASNELTKHICPKCRRSFRQNSLDKMEKERQDNKACNEYFEKVRKGITR